MDARSALVRFETVRRDEGGAGRDPQAWVAVIEYSFSGEPVSVEDRYVNPLGFQVTKLSRITRRRGVSEVRLSFA